MANRVCPYCGVKNRMDANKCIHAISPDLGAAQLPDAMRAKYAVRLYLQSHGPMASENFEMNPRMAGPGRR